MKTFRIVLNHKGRKFILLLFKSYLEKKIGLMLKKIKEFDGAIFVLNRESKYKASIHTFFMLEPIDIIWLNKEGIVVDKRMNVKPFRVVIPRERSKYVIELKTPLGKYFEIGDAVNFSTIFGRSI